MKRHPVFAEGFRISENDIIIGARNDIGRSVEVFDFDLRRLSRRIDIDADEQPRDIILADIANK